MNENAQTPELDTRTRNIIKVTILAYVGILLVMALMGKFAFISKVSLLPIFFLVALVTKRLVSFIKEWSVFLALVILFDSLRGYAYYLTTSFHGNVFMNYVVAPEKAIFGDKVATNWLQDMLFEPGNIGVLEQVLTVVHGSHFMCFLLFGLGIWYFRKDDFGKFKIGMILVMYLGLLGYFLVPTIPPWMASSDYRVIPTVHRFYGQVYNTAVPSLRTAFDINPIAAMPSLHTAFPVFISIVSLHHFRWKGLLFVAYTLIMAFALVYGGEHFILDELAGIGVAGFVYWLVYRSTFLSRISGLFKKRAKAEDSHFFRLLDTPIKQKLAITLFLLIIAEISGQIVLNQLEVFIPAEDFIERELDGKSDLVSYYRGGYAFNAGDMATAQREFCVSMKEAGPKRVALESAGFCIVSAHANGDYPVVIRAAGNLPREKVSPRIGVLVATAYARIGKIDSSLDYLANLLEAYPCHAGLISLKTQTAYLNGRIDHDGLMEIIRQLEMRIGDKPAHENAMLLRDLAKQERVDGGSESP